jgi:phage tail protein X
MRPEDVSHEIAKARATFDDTIDALANTVWRDTIEPLCKRRKLHYLAGMGRTVFYANHRGEVVSIGSAEDAEHDHGGRFAYLAPVFRDLIDLELPGVDCLGFRIADSDHLPKAKGGAKK